MRDKSYEYLCLCHSFPASKPGTDSSQNLQRGRKLEDYCNSSEGKRLPQGVLSGEKLSLNMFLTPNNWHKSEPLSRHHYYNESSCHSFLFHCHQNRSQNYLTNSKYLTAPSCRHLTKWWSRSQRHFYFFRFFSRALSDH